MFFPSPSFPALCCASPIGASAIYRSRRARQQRHRSNTRGHFRSPPGRAVGGIGRNHELLPGIKLVHTGGHTPGHFGIEIESGGTKVFYYADVFSTAAHMKVPFVPATDLNPVETMEVKRRVLPIILSQEVVMAFDHDIYTPLAKIKEAGRKLVVEPVQTGLAEYQKE